MKKSTVKKTAIAAAIIVVIIVLALCVVDVKCTVDFDHMLTVDELREFEARNDVYVHGVGMITIEKETGEIGSGLINFRGYDTLESDIMSTVRDMQGEPLNDRYITSAYVMSPIIKISKIKKDDAVYNAEYAFDFKGGMNFGAYPQTSAYNRAGELWEKSAAES